MPSHARIATRPADARTAARAQIREEYQRLLARFRRRRLGSGPEPRLEGSHPQPMTYALLSMAEASSPWSDPPDRLIPAVDWLLRNADLDRDGRPGWGLPQEWDAFGDGLGAAGTTNPPHHPYTITTAFVVDALVAAVRRGALDDSRRRRATRLVTSVAQRWTSTAMSPCGSGAFFWYSPHESDARFCPNVSAMMAGALYAACQVGLVRGRSGVDTAVDAAVAGVAAARRDAPGGTLAWPYIEGGGAGRLNDGVHHAYTLWGMERYRAEGGSVALGYGRGDATASLLAFIRKNRLCEQPVDESRGAHCRPMRLWGAGMTLAVLARLGSIGAALKVARLVTTDYSGPQGPLLVPNASPAIVYPRHAAHLLFGLAALAERLDGRAARGRRTDRSE